MKTKFGNVKIGNNGYYTITTRKEGNHKKLLHRLIWEEYHGKPVPEGYYIHHINGDKLDNRIENLECMERGLHSKFHNMGEKHSQAKYTLWNIKSVYYSKNNMFEGGREPNPCKCFKYKYKGKYVSIGYFHDFISVGIIDELVKDAIGV